MQTFTSARPAVRSPHGLVAAQNRHAAEAGAAVLSRGGNAMDAAIVTALVLSVVEPWLVGRRRRRLPDPCRRQDGRDRDARFQCARAAGLDPARLSADRGRSGNWFAWPSVVGDRNVSGYTCDCVPGAIAGFAAALERHGTISWDEALQPAIEHAERGLEIDWYAALCIAVEVAALVARSRRSPALLLDDGQRPQGRRRHTPLQADARQGPAAAAPRHGRRTRLLRGRDRAHDRRRSRSRRLGHPHARLRGLRLDLAARRSPATIATSRSTPFRVSAAGRASSMRRGAVEASGSRARHRAGRRGAGLRHGHPRSL